MTHISVVPIVECTKQRRINSTVIHVAMEVSIKSINLLLQIVIVMIKILASLRMTTCVP